MAFEVAQVLTAERALTSEHFLSESGDMALSSSQRGGDLICLSPQGRNAITLPLELTLELLVLVLRPTDVVPVRTVKLTTVSKPSRIEIIRDGEGDPARTT